MTPTLGSLFVGKHNNLTFRLLAALTVIYGHTPAVVPGTPADWVTRTTNYAFSGGVAVDLFFLISGFLVTASILKGGVRRYLVARVLRIYPALWVNLILTGMQNCIYACTAALICGFMPWHLVEKRAMKLKDGFSARLGLAPMRTITST